MKVIFFEVDGLMNLDAVAPSGKPGVADSAVKQLKKLMQETESRIVLTGSWAKDWDFYEDRRTEDGKYLSKKFERKGVHILDKTDDISSWMSRHPNVTEYCVLKNFSDVRWEEWA